MMEAALQGTARHLQAVEGTRGTLPLLEGTVLAYHLHLSNPTW